MGTPDFAVPTLRQLIKYHDVVAVYTQPDRPAGRGNKILFSPIKALAIEAGIEVLQPETFQKKDVRDYLTSLGADIFVVAAYGLILRKAVLSIPRLGCVNVHGSLLPKYRGASPIHAAIQNGDTTTGITIMYMDTGIDTGDMILKREIAIDSDERIQSLHDKMAVLGGECLIDALAQIESGASVRTPQDDSLSTYAPMIKKADGLIDWKWSTIEIINLTRAFDPWPGPYTIYNGHVLKIWRVEETEVEDINTKELLPGTVVLANPVQGLVVQTGSGLAKIVEIQAPNGKRMTATEFLRGREIKTGEMLG